MKYVGRPAFVVAAHLVVLGLAASGPAFAQQKPNIVILMTDDTGRNDFGAYSGGGMSLGHPTPIVHRIAKEGAVFTSWYGQASCTAGRASFLTGRIPIRSALTYPALIEFDQSIMKYPSIKRFPGGASNDLIPNLRHPDNPVPLLDPKNMPKVVGPGAIDRGSSHRRPARCSKSNRRRPRPLENVTEQE